MKAEGESAQIGRSPASWWGVKALFFKPSEFYAKAQLDLHPLPVLAAWIAGMAAVIDRVDMQLLKADLSGHATTTLKFLTSWTRLWILVLVAGVAWGAFIWFIGGWWYKKRVRWSGAADANPRSARLVYIYASFVSTVPAVLYVALAVPLFKNYVDLWERDPGWSTLLLVPLAWSLVVSYRGVLVTFPVKRSRARWWFLILPALLYIGVIIAFGIAAVMSGVDEPA